MVFHCASLKRQFGSHLSFLQSYALNDLAFVVLIKVKSQMNRLVFIRLYYLLLNSLNNYSIYLIPIVTVFPDLSM